MTDFTNRLWRQLTVVLAAMLCSAGSAHAQEAIGVRDLTLTARGFVLRAEQVEIAGSSQPLATLEAALRASDPDGLIGRLERLGASGVTFTNVSVERAEGGQRAILGFQRLTLAGLSQGRAANARGTAGRYVLGVAAPTTFQNMTATSLDIAFLFRLIGDAAPNADAARPLVGTATFERLEHVTSAGARFTAQRFALFDLRIMPGAQRGDLGVLGAVEVSDILLGTGPRPGGPPPLEARIRSIAIGADRPTADDVPTRYRARFDDVAVPLRPDDPTPATRNLRALELDAIRASGGFEASWSPRSRELRLDRFGLEFADLGSITYAALIANVSPEAFTERAAIANSRWGEAQLRSMSLTLKDLGFYRRVIDREAKARSRPPAEIRADVARAAEEVVRRTTAGIANRTVPDAIARFVANPGTLFVSIAPKQGSTIALSAVMALGGLAQIADRLEVVARTE
jgi:hypothetical protein